MKDFSASVAQNMILIKAGRELKKEIEQAGLETLKLLAENGISIVGTYINGCSPQKQAEIRKNLTYLLSMGISCDMLINELARQIPELAPIMTDKEAYRKAELSKIEQFLRST